MRRSGGAPASPNNAGEIASLQEEAVKAGIPALVVSVDPIAA
jgi:hypothetical protein